MSRATSAGRRSLLARARAVVAHRELLGAFTKREVQVRYKQAFLGMAWAVFLPFVMMLIWTKVRSQLFEATADDGVSPALVIYLSFLVWTYFQTSVKGCTGTLITNKNLLSKVYFPREVFPLAKIGAATVDFAVGLAVLFGLMFWFGQPPQWSTLLLPLVLLVHVLLMTGLGMLLSALNLFYRDVQYVMDVLLLIGMLASPVLVHETAGRVMIGSFDVLKHGNPMHPVIMGYRDVLLYGEFQDPKHMAFGAGFALVVFLVGFFAFSRMEPRFAERV